MNRKLPGSSVFLVEKYERIVTDYEKIHALHRNIAVIACHGSPLYLGVPVLPPYADAIIKIFLVFYNKLDNKLNEGKKQTSRCNQYEIIEQLIRSVRSAER